MLAVRAEPFDSPEYLFEVKWDGVRTLAACEASGWRLWGRQAADYTARYPELGTLRRLPPGTLLDGEIILCQGGRPHLPSLLSRHQLLGPQQIEAASRVHPVTYVVFDLLALRDRMLLAQPLQARRELLQGLLGPLQEPRLVFSAGVVAAGRQFFIEAVRQGQEGVMAKHLASRYRPGRRSAAWKKIKPGFRACLVAPCSGVPSSGQGPATTLQGSTAICQSLCNAARYAARGQGVSMANRLLIEKYHLAVFAPSGLRERRYRAIRHALDSRRLRLELSRAGRQVFGRYPALQHVRIQLSR
jgi:hypothetical protein